MPEHKCNFYFLYSRPTILGKEYRFVCKVCPIRRDVLRSKFWEK